MKANAPEKIYLQENTTTDCYGELWPELFYGRAKDSDIEYTRTDAFIEKACEFLTNEANIPLWEGYNGTFGCDTSKLVQNFINYMKGE